MKTLRFLLASIMMMMTVCVANAQDKDDFWTGKWEFEVTGMPQGDATMILVLQRDNEGKLTGYIQQSPESPKNPLTRVDEKKESITAFFKSSGYDVYMFAEKTGNDEVEGSVFDMFDATGRKVKE